MSKRKRTGVHIIPKPPENLVTDTVELWQKRLNALLDGKAAAPNPFVAYLAAQVAKAHDERTMLLAQLRQINSQANQMRERVTALNGQIDAQANDIKAWWDHGPTSAAKDSGKPFLLQPESEALDARAHQSPDPQA